MAKLDDVARQVMDKSEWVAIATTGPNGPHVAATWGGYIRTLGVRDDLLLIPAGHYHQTEANLQRDPRIELLFATRQVAGNHGPGRGCCITGTAELQVSGVHADAVKAKFAWARGALVVTIEKAALQL